MVDPNAVVIGQSYRQPSLPPMKALLSVRNDNKSYTWNRDWTYWNWESSGTS